MAKQKTDLPPEEWKPRQAVPDPIITSPYKEPQQHWLYREGVIHDGRGAEPRWFLHGLFA